jgi:hypothetical protein
MDGSQPRELLVNEGASMKFLYWLQRVFGSLTSIGSSARSMRGGGGGE